MHKYKTCVFLSCKFDFSTPFLSFEDLLFHLTLSLPLLLLLLLFARAWLLRIVVAAISARMIMLAYWGGCQRGGR